MRSFAPFPEMTSALEGADHLDIKVVEGETTLRQFIASMIAYQPGWITFLYRVRAVFVRLLGMRQSGIPHAPRLRADQIPMNPGDSFGFFKVRSAEEDHYFLAEVADSHLKAILGVVMEPIGDGQQRFYVVTIVHYRNWAGPVYFNVIRPFHHLVVGNMARAGIRQAQQLP